jgi:hypothetical protein
MAEMRKLTRYFCLLSPESKWDSNAERIFDDLFHPEVKIVGKNKSFNFQEWKDWYKRSIEDGLVLDMGKIVRTSPDSIVYTLLVHQDNGTVLSHTAKGIFKDGKMIRTEPADPSIYDIMAAKKRRVPVDIL